MCIRDSPEAVYIRDQERRMNAINRGRQVSLAALHQVIGLLHRHT